MGRAGGGNRSRSAVRSPRSRADLQPVAFALAPPWEEHSHGRRDPWGRLEACGDRHCWESISEIVLERPKVEHSSARITRIAAEPILSTLRVAIMQDPVTVMHVRTANATKGLHSEAHSERSRPLAFSTQPKKRKFEMRTFLSPAAWLASVALMLSFALPLSTARASASALQNTPVTHCRGSQANKNATTGKWSLMCIGNECTTNCKSRLVTCGGVDMTACACAGGSHCPDDNCCQVTLTDAGVPTFFGDCPSCTLMGTCRICGTPASAPTQYQPSCSPCS